MEQQIKITTTMLPISDIAAALSERFNEKQPVPPLNAYTLALRDPATFSSHVLDKPTQH